MLHLCEKENPPRSHFHFKFDFRLGGLFQSVERFDSILLLMLRPSSPFSVRLQVQPIKSSVLLSWRINRDGPTKKGKGKGPCPIIKYQSSERPARERSRRRSLLTGCHIASKYLDESLLGLHNVDVEIQLLLQHANAIVGPQSVRGQVS